MTAGPQPYAKCRRCSRRRDAHVDGDPCVFLGHQPATTGASQSFTGLQIAVLEVLVANALRGVVSSQITRHPAFASLARKVFVMRKSADKRAAARAARKLGDAP